MGNEKMWQGNENLCSYGHEMHLNNTNVIVTCILVHVLYIYIYIYTHTHTHTHRVSQEECAILWESVPYVKEYQYNPKHISKVEWL